MLHRTALGALLGSLALLAAGYGAAFLPGGAPGWAPWLLLVGMTGTVWALLVLGAIRGGRIGALALPFGFLALVLLGGFGVALRMGPGGGGWAADAPLILGLPAGGALVLLGVGFLPLLVLPLAYAATFDRLGLDEAGVADLVERARAAAPSGSAPPSP